MFRTFLILVAAPLALAGCASIEATAPAQSFGAAAANDPRAGEVGEAILRQGGSATDAAIAMMLALAVIEPQSSGLGGGAFYIRGGADGAVETIDGREIAPQAAEGDWFLDGEGNLRGRNEAIQSGLSVGVPGAVALAAAMHRRHGRLPWPDLFAPAIALARDGFAITPRLSGSLASSPDRAGRTAEGREMFYLDDGTALTAGSLARLPALAETLEMIAREGPESFYEGEFAAALAARIAADTPRAEGMTALDLANYTAKERDAACTIYRLHRVCTMGPPSSGGVAMLAILKQLEGYDLAALGQRNAATWHLFLESQRLAFADRELYVADPDFVEVPLAGLLDPAYLARRAALIDPGSAMPDAAPGRPEGAPQALATGDAWPESGTTHFAVADGQGNMVSVTATVEGGFGSGLVHGGFYLNNELTDFSLVPEQDGRPVANRVEGGKRPASSMSPTVVYDPHGQPLLTVGAAGGTLIPVQTARAIIGVIDFGLTLEEALGLPFVMSVGGGTVLVEQGTWMEGLAPEFERLGHARIVSFGGLLRTTGALRTEDGWRAAFDPRLIELVAIPAEPEQAPSLDAGYSEGQ